MIDPDDVLRLPCGLPGGGEAAAGRQVLRPCARLPRRHPAVQGARDGTGKIRAGCEPWVREAAAPPPGRPCPSCAAAPLTHTARSQHVERHLVRLKQPGGAVGARHGCAAPRPLLHRRHAGRRQARQARPDSRPAVQLPFAPPTHLLLYSLSNLSRMVPKVEAMAVLLARHSRPKGQPTGGVLQMPSLKP